MDALFTKTKFIYINLKRGSDISSRTSIMATCTRNGNFSIAANSPYTSLGEAIEREEILNLNHSAVCLLLYFMAGWGDVNALTIAWEHWRECELGHSFVV